MTHKNSEFLLTLDFEGRHYNGTIIPSDEKDQTGMPVYFRVTLENEFYAYLCCGTSGWSERDNSGKPDGLIRAIGNYIFEYYE
jgi:hypothetical protein